MQVEEYDDDLLNKTIKGGLVSTSDSVLSLDTVDHIAHYFKHIKDINVGWASEIK